LSISEHFRGPGLFQGLVRRCLAGPYRLLKTAFPPGTHPFDHLGALTIFFFWIVLISGIWLFIFFRTSVDGAYESVEYLTWDQRYYGGVMRSLHRYASDAAVITLALHILKEFAFDRYRTGRWFSWITGVPLLWLVFPLGITGYWLVWDRLAQYVALTSAELIDWLPVLTDSMARNFLSPEALSDRFFTLLAFLHLIGLPLFLVLGIWVHVFRINTPRINPPRLLMASALLGMLVLSLVFPAISQGKADLTQAPGDLGLDWFYLVLYPLLKTWSPGSLWALLAGISGLLMIAPWLPPAKPVAVARVDLSNCNGCERCVADCPFGAVAMAPRSDGLEFDAEAVVNPDLCISCGICVGACPTATPFRKASKLSPGIDMPELTTAQLREQVIQASKSLSGAGKARVIVFGCHSDRGRKGLADDFTALVSVRCMAQIPPSFIDFILSRDLADGVMLTGCAGSDCQYRLGQTWTEQRLGRQRDPRLRKRVDDRRVAMSWRLPWSSMGTPDKALAEFRNRLALTGHTAGAAESLTDSETGRWRRLTLSTLAHLPFYALIGIVSVWPRLSLLEPSEAMVSLTFSHAGQRIEECRKVSQEELMKLPPNMRKPSDCPRERHPVRVEFRVDDLLVVDLTAPPTGLSSDGKSTVYRRLPISSGEHLLSIGMVDSGRADGFDYQMEARVSLDPQQHIVVEFDHDLQTFLIR
jgi:quinol-cytochrome oxidoreductase complex cytochrome b subunit/coenzyme F420-reducing hydrogenase delta subunit